MTLDGAKILVTGAAGFIGSHLAHRLLDAGATVHGIDNLNAYYDIGLKEARLARLSKRNGFGFDQLDVAGHDGVLTLMRALKPDYVAHLAAQAGVRHSIDNPRAYGANIEGFLSVLEACRAQPVKHLIYASSSSVYGANAKVPFHEDDPASQPLSLYAATKRSNELMAAAYSHLYRIPASGLRFFTVYGPWGRPDMAYFSFTKALLEGRAIDLYNHGELERDFTFIDDVCEGISRLIEKPPAGDGAPHRLYNIGNHTPVKLVRFVAAIEAATGRKAETRLLPMQPGDVPSTYADVDRLTRATGFSPDTKIEDGIRRFVEWYRGYYAV